MTFSSPFGHASVIIYRALLTSFHEKDDAFIAISQEFGILPSVGKIIPFIDYVNYFP